MLIADSAPTVIHPCRQSIPVAATAAAAESAAAPASTTAAASTAVSTAATAAASTTASTGSILARLGFVHFQSAAINFLAVQSGDGGFGLIIAAHLHEAEAFAAARLAVVDDLGAGHRAVLGEQLL
jgi:hypothetical protein